MEWSDMTSQESQRDDWILEEQKENLDIDTFMQKPVNFESFNNENDSDYYSTFPSTGPKQMFKVTVYSSASPSHIFSQNENKIKEENSLNINKSFEDLNQSNQNKLSTMTISERMKYKKEKAKLLLEKKFKKEEISLEPDATIPINEDEELNNANESFNNNDNEMINKKTKRDLLLMDHSCSPLNNEKVLTKKEIKMLRNRASAQRSRDRRKREFDELHLFTKNIQKENNQLKAEIAKRDIEMEQIKNKIMSLCGNCKKTFNFFNWESSCHSSDHELSHGKIVVDHNISGNKKYSLITGLFVILCVIGTIAINTNLTQTQLTQNNSNRILQEKTLPFEIIKDYSKKRTREAEFLYKKRKEFLIKEFNSNEMKFKVTHEEKKNEDGFLNLHQEEADINLKNAQKEEKSISTQVVPLSFYEERQDIKSLLCKDFITSNENNFNLFKNFFQNTHIDSSKTNLSDYSTLPQIESNNNTLSKQLNLRHDYDLKKHIKDLPKENSNIEDKKNCFDKPKPISSNDLILHMIIPTEDIMENQNVSKNSNPNNDIDNSFYEVGCKIFEINKIYK